PSNTASSYGTPHTAASFANAERSYPTRGWHARVRTPPPTARSRGSEAAAPRCPGSTRPRPRTNRSGEPRRRQSDNISKAALHPSFSRAPRGESKPGLSIIAVSSQTRAGHVFPDQLSIVPDIGAGNPIMSENQAIGNSGPYLPRAVLRNRRG